MRPVHWDDVEVQREELASLRGSCQDLGAAAGSVGAGVTRWRADPRAQTTPAHVGADEEQIVYVLSGSGRLWQGGATHAIGAGDAIVHRAGEEPRTLVAGDDVLDVLVFGERRWTGRRASEPEAEQRRVEPGEPAPRPANVVSTEDVDAVERRRGDVARAWRDLGRAAGSVRTGLKHAEIAPGALGCPPHCHSAEEEIFVVLAGDGVLLLGEEELEVRAGHVISRPPGTGVAHAFRAGPGGLTQLAYGTREPNDIAWFPRSQKVYLRGIDVIARVEQLDYWHGEE